MRLSRRRARSATGRSTKSPDGVRVAAPALAANAASTSRAQACSRAESPNTARTGSSCRGLSTDCAPKPSAFAVRACRTRPSGSSRRVYTLFTGPGRPAAREATTSTERG